MKIHMLFPYAAAYREPIYTLLDKELDCVFHFCSNTDTSLKQMNYSVLKDCRFDISEKVIRGQWRVFNGISKIGFKKNDVIICPGNIRYLSIWRLLLHNRIIKRYRIILWSHGAYGRESKLQYFLKKIFYRLSDHVFLYGNYAKDLFIKHHILDQNKMTVVWNSLDYDRQIIYRSKECNNIIREHFNNEFPTILFIGRLTYEKKLDMLVEALHRLALRNEFYNCVFIGKGEAEDSIIQTSNSYCMKDRIWLYGSCYNDEEMFPLIKNADICVSPGNVGLTAIHVMTYGIPVISHDDYTHQGPEFEAIKEGVTGSFFKNDSIESLVECISNWLKNRPSKDVVSENCYRVIDNCYNPHAQVNIIKNALCLL